MKKLALFIVLFAAVANACAMDLSTWLSEEYSKNKSAEQIEQDARVLVQEGKMTEAELAQVLASIKN
jgi:hypothetical protein